MARSMLNASHNRAVDNLMPERNDKRREEGANPMPAKPKARQTKPKREAEGPPEEQQEPRGQPGRPKNTQVLTDLPKQASPNKSPAKPKAQAQPEQAPEEPKSKQKPVKKDMPAKKPAHDTEMQHFAPSVWKQKNKAFLIDQYMKRNLGYLTGKEAQKNITKNELVEKIVEYDKKQSK